MHSNAWAARAVLVGVLAVISLPAQLHAQGVGHDGRDQIAGGIPASPKVSLKELDRGTWMDVDARGVHAHGTRYKSRFDRDGMVFTPALGSAAPFNQDFHLRAMDISRGGELLELATAAAEPDGDSVVYRRRDVLERFDIRAEGIEHSYVLDRLPSGDGDLVIRHRVATPLVAQGTGGDDGVRFLLADVGGIDIGGVTGIDATGARFRGEVIHREGVLEYRLPAADVADAVLPLTVDPFLTVFILQAVINDEQLSDVAYDTTTGNWAFCWERVFSGTDSDIRARILDSSLGVVLSLVGITNDSLRHTQPKIANINASDGFIIVWNQFTTSVDIDVRARGLLADGTLGSNTVTVQGGASNQSAPDIAGDSSIVDNDAIVVYIDAANSGDIWAEQLQLNASGALSVFAARVNLSNGGATYSDLSPAITKTGGGTTNRYMVVWSRAGLAANNNSAIRGAVVDRNLTVLDSFIAVTGTTYDYDDPDVDGDGSVFVVAYERSESTAGTGEDDIGVTTLIWDPNTAAGEILVGDTVIGSSASDDENDPAVCFLGEEVLVCFEDVDLGTTTDYDIRYFAVDPFTCLSCETLNSLAAFSSTRRERFPALASKGSGGSGIDQAMLVFTTEDLAASNDGDLEARLFDPIDGDLQGLGGGCGFAGDLRVGCARSPNANAQIQLIGATFGATAWLVVSPGSRDIPCGNCILVPDPYTGLIAVSTVGVSGTASFPIAVPSGLVGREVLAQWLVSSPTPACPGFGTDLTPAYRITLQ